MNWIVILLSSLVQAVPVHFAARFLGGESSYGKAFVLTVGGVVAAALAQQYAGSWAGLVSFLLLLCLYKVGFNMGWLRAFFVWLLSIVFAVLLFVLLTALGIAVVSFA